MRILFITDYLPYPLISGDRIRVYNLIRRIAREHEVSLAAALWTPDEAESVSHLREFCCRVETASLRWRHPLTLLPGLLHYALAGKPLELRFLYSGELVNKIRQLVSARGFNVVNIEHSRMALYLEALPLGARCTRVLAFHNIASYQYGRILRVERRPITRMRALLHSLMMRRWEPHYAERFDRCITVSKADRGLLMAANPRLRIDVIPNGVDTQTCRPLGLEGMQIALLFIGSMSYAPCADGAIWFCNQILPRIRRAIPEVHVWIVGNSPPPEVVKLGSDGVYVTGRVEDIVPYYRQSAVCIVPLRAGGGTRLKILEAMALGRPVVSTTIGCEGLEVVHGQHLLIADDPEEFAEHITRLLTDKALYQHIIAQARQLVLAKYDWDSLAQQLVDVYARQAMTTVRD